MGYSLGYKKEPEEIIVGGKNPNFLASLDLDLDVYDDISSIVDWFHSDVMDWSRRRDEIKTLFFAKTGLDLAQYSDLTSEEKEIGARLFFLPYAVRTTIFTDEEDNLNFKFLLVKTKRSRVECIEAMRQAVGDKLRIGALSLQQTQRFDRDTYNMISLFERSNHPEFKLWLTSTSGVVDGEEINHEEDGFDSKTYYDADLKDKLLAIYNGGY